MNVAPITRRLLSIARAASPSQIDRGMTWYDEANREVARMAVSYGFPLDVTARAFAECSPAVTVRQNIRTTETILANESWLGTGTGTVYAAGYRANINRAIAQARGTRSRRNMGLKVGPFSDAILGDFDALVLDRWAYRAAGVSDVPRVGERRAVIEAYKRAAKAMGWTLRETQAIIWVTYRDSNARADYKDNIAPMEA